MAESGGDLRRMGWGNPGSLCLSFLSYLLVPNMGSNPSKAIIQSI